MNVFDIKFWCKQAVEHTRLPLSRSDKEVVKQAIDHSSNFYKLELIVFAVCAFY